MDCVLFNKLTFKFYFEGKIEKLVENEKKLMNKIKSKTIVFINSYTQHMQGIICIFLYSFFSLLFTTVTMWEKDVINCLGDGLDISYECILILWQNLVYLNHNSSFPPCATHHLFDLSNHITQLPTNKL